MSQVQILLCVPNTPDGETTLRDLTDTLVPRLVDSGLARFDIVQDGTWGYGIATVIPDNHLAETLRAQALAAGHELVRQIALDVTDQATVEAEIERLIAGTDLAGRFHVGRWLKITEEDAAAFLNTPEPPAAPSVDTGKSIEIYYDASHLPPGYGDPLTFRNAAMELVEAALAEAGVGAWAGAESGANLQTGAPEVNFGFEVTDFHRAEKIVRDTVRGTPFDRIREIARFDSGEAS